MLSASEWTRFNLCQGPAGATGPAGPTGPTGSVGATGATGPAVSVQTGTFAFSDPSTNVAVASITALSKVVVSLETIVYGKSAQAGSAFGISITPGVGFTVSGDGAGNRDGCVYTYIVFIV